jgi:hypothetical protein
MALGLTAQDKQQRRNARPPTPEPEGPRAEFAQLAKLIAKHRGDPGQVLMMITVRMAIAMLELNGDMPSLNRPCRPGKVAEWTRMMRTGHWHLIHQGIMIDINGHLRDGQHRLSAIIQFGQPVEMFVCFGLPPEAFEHVDNGHKRTSADLLTIEGVPYTVQSSATAGFLIYLADPVRPWPNSQEVLHKTRELREQGPVFDDAIKAGSRLRKLHGIRESAMSAAYYTIAVNTAHSDRLPAFWEKLATGENIGRRDARYRLREYLISPKSMPHMAGGTASRGVQVRQAAAVILAWNAWIDGRVGKSLGWDEPALPPVEGK